jgi:2-keto-4-pentenoate hydratase/2-oxohepta-3-ene-1,7-dioic acid hydratase in catechol pathway
MTADAARWGVVEGSSLHPVPGDFPSLAALLSGGRDAAQATEGGAPVPLASVRLLGPVTGPCHIVCQGLNYAQHRAESGQGATKPPFNLLFTKAWSALSGPFDDVVRPDGVSLLDYEIELGVVVGRAIRGPVTVTDGDLHEYVAGIVMANDVSARDVQIPQLQWFKGKSFRTFCPVGPYLYLLDPEDVPRLRDIDLELRVNGEVRQRASTAQLLYGPAETLTELSRVMDLEPGDLLLTGTPGGVAMQAPSPLTRRLGRALLSEQKMLEVFVKRQQANPGYLENGDVITCTMRTPDGAIDLGEMRTRVVAAQQEERR